MTPLVAKSTPWMFIANYSPLSIIYFFYHTRWQLNNLADTITPKCEIINTLNRLRQ